jgi:hypothetical protein
MRNPIRKCGYLAVAALLYFASGAFAQVTCASAGVTCASVTYTGGTSASVETSAGTVSYTVLSTDYLDSLSSTSTSTTAYDAFQQGVGPLDPADDGTMFGSAITSDLTTNGSSSSYASVFYATNAQQIYELAADVGNLMISTCGATDAACQSNYQDAVWYLFDPYSVALTTIYEDNSTVTDIINSLPAPGPPFDQTIPTSAYSNALVLSPCYGTGCGGTGVDPACPSGGLSGGVCGQQELLAFTTPTKVVATPESSEPLLLGADLLGLLGIAFMFRRRLIRVNR